ncbi:hypothetical protein FGIG_06087 [Fasciola gigantica]|uniref:Protein kinase domain-containing protein n=1 Tax=Fasciola gigantica TaxID=46835 RepID=A0A504YRY3_FASGI|nr:hypothetical protein FGIG_06087 [Fasciola gigantica]
MLQDGFQTSCLIELYIPCHTLVWSTTSAYESKISGQEREESAPSSQCSSASHSLDQIRTESRSSTKIALRQIRPNHLYITKLLVKVCTNDPNLGSRLRQSNDGTYLVDRVIPCCACLASPPSFSCGDVQSKSRFRVKKCRSRRKNLIRSHSVELPGSSSTASSDSPPVYGITVREYLHWLTMNPTHENATLAPNISNGTTNPPRLYCPFHTSVPFQAGDLHFDDLSSLLKFGANSIDLSRFLGRGAFGSVFAGTLVIQSSDPTSGQIDPQNTHSIPVAVKLSTPIHPKLLDDHTEVGRQDCMAADDVGEDIREALILHRQEQRRWLQNPMEASWFAYHVRISDGFPSLWLHFLVWKTLTFCHRNKYS